MTDLHAAAALIRESWRENRESTLDYGEEFLRSCLEYPGKPVLTPAIFDQDGPAAMVCGMPRHAILRGEKKKLLLMSFFTVAPRWKGQGLGKTVWAECLRQARDAGFDGAIHYCAEGNVSNHVTVKAAQSAGFEPVRVMSVRFLQKLLRPASGGAAGKAAVEDFLEAANTVEAPLRRVWTRAEAEWQMHGRTGAISVTERDGAAAGAITGYFIGSSDGTRCAMVEDVLWGGPGPERQEAMLATFLESAARQAEIAVVPVLGYADLPAFRRAGFRLSRRVLNAYLTMWSGTPASELSGFYMDVL